jgi:hypothetical protein
MRLFSEFLRKISNASVPESFAGREAYLAKLNPDKIYVENVRSLFDVSYTHAVRICETAVRQGLFARFVEVLCPDDVVAASAPSEAELPPHVRCLIEHDGEMEEKEFETAALKKLTFYRLIEAPDSDVRQSA